MTCTKCSLHKTATTVKVESRGSIDPIIMFVGVAPDRSEDLSGFCFEGKAGKKQAAMLRKVGLESRHCRWSLIVRCVPWKDDCCEEIRDPIDEEVNSCYLYLEKEIQKIKPTIIVPLGNIALKLFVPNAPGITKARGRRYISQVPFKQTLIKQFKKILEVKGISSKGKSYNQLAMACARLGFNPEIKHLTIIPSFGVNTVLYKSKYNRKNEESMLSDYRYLATLISKDKDKKGEEYYFCDSLEKVEEKCNDILELFAIGSLDRIHIDIEADRFNPREDGSTLLLFSICYGKGQAFSIPWDHKDSPFYKDKLIQNAIKGILNKLLEKVPVSNHNVKFDIHWLYEFGIFVRKVANCTYLASWTLFNDSMYHDLESLASKFTPFKQHKEELERALRELEGFVFDSEGNLRQPNYGDVEIDLLHRYCCLDVDSTRELDRVFTQMMIEQNVLEAHNKYTVAAILPVVSMERNGIRYNVDYAKVTAKEYEDRIAGYHSNFYNYGYLDEAATLIEKDRGKPPVKKKLQLSDDSVVEVVKLSSTDVKRKILFDILNLPSVKATAKDKDKDEFPSTDKEVLSTLLELCVDSLVAADSTAVGFYKHRIEVIEDLINFNYDSTIYSRYLSKLPSYVDSSGITHTSFGIGTTDTTRWNCTNPSLHIIPKKSTVKVGFEPIFSDGLILLADYSQNELRAIALLSGDKTLRQNFLDGKDLHKEVSTYFGISRRVAKAVNFGIAFGQTEYGLAAQLKISKKEASKYISDWYGRFSGVKQWVKEQHLKSKKKDRIIIKTGFHRLMPKDAMFSESERKRRFVNTPVQGSASNFGGLALIILDSYLTALKCKSKMFAFIHDALGLSIYPGELYQVAKLVKNVMEQKVPQQIDWIDLPLVSDFEVGVTWGELVNMQVLDNNCVQLSGLMVNMKKLLLRMKSWSGTTKVVESESYEEDGDLCLNLKLSFVG